MKKRSFIKYFILIIILSTLLVSTAMYITNYLSFPLSYTFLIIFGILGLVTVLLQLFASRLFGAAKQNDEKLPETEPHTVISSSPTNILNFTDALNMEEQIRFEVKNVAREIEQAQDTIEEEQAELELTKAVSTDINEILHVASINSRAALLLLSAKIEEQMRIHLQEIGLLSKTNYALSRQAVDMAVREGLIPHETASAFHDFLAIRNKVAHGAAFDVDEATILALVSIGIELLKVISAKKREDTELLRSDTM